MSEINEQLWADQWWVCTGCREIVEFGRFKPGDSGSPLLEDGKPRFHRGKDCVVEQVLPGPLKLNLASGTDIRPRPWLNLDVVKEWKREGMAPAKCDLLWDARSGIIPFPDDSVDEIYAGYLFLHIQPRFRDAMWKEIHRVLKPLTGIVVIGEVDMELAMKRWLADPLDVSANEMIWGELGSVHGSDLAEFDQHTHGYSEKRLRNVMENVGFSQLRRIKVHGEATWYELTITGVKT